MFITFFPGWGKGNDLSFSDRARLKELEFVNLENDGYESRFAGEQIAANAMWGNNPVIGPDDYVWNTFFWETGVFAP